MSAQEKRSLLSITGMTCANCAAAVQKALSSVPGVSEANVNLATEQATVTYNPSTVQFKDLKQAVTKAGYDIEATTTTLTIEGMTCAVCQQTVINALQNLEGVLSASVNLALKTAAVTYTPQVTSTEDMKRAVEKVGYHVISAGAEPASHHEHHHPHLKHARFRILLGFIVGIPLMILVYIPVVFPIPLGYFMLIVSTPVFLYIGYPIFISAGKALRHKRLTMDVMYSMGIGVSFAASVLGTFNIVFTPEFMFYDTAILLATFLILGRYLEMRATGRTSEAIKKLVGLQAKTATVLRDGKETELPIDDVQIGDIVLIKPGGKIPVDGVVIEGDSAVDESMITGEPLPASKQKGSTVIGGTINTVGVLTVRATRIGKETMLAQIIRLVAEAQGSKPPAQRIADKAVTYFIPIILFVAVITFLAWFFFGKGMVPGNQLQFSLTAFISVIVIACPCALGLATPTAVTVGIGRGAELGILIKNGEALEMVDKISIMAMDKTGTLTIGKPVITDIIGVASTESEALRLAASVEKNSSHPLAAAVVAKAEEQHLSLGKGTGFTTIGGRGIQATIEHQEVLIGNLGFMESKGIEVSPDDRQRIIGLEADGKTVLLVGSNRKLLGILGAADTLKPTSREAVRQLHAEGLKVIVITGDNPQAAKAIADKVGADEVYANVLPEEKTEKIRALQAQGDAVGFVGDGINDAPALATADVGIAIGSGTDVAIESGEIILVRSDLLDCVAAIQLGRKVLTRIKQNLFWAFAYNAALIPVAAGVLYPFFGIIFRPEYAALAMAFSSVSVVSWSLSLKGYTPPVKRGQASTSS